MTPTTSPSSIAAPDEVLQFWFGAARPTDVQALQVQKQWFTKSDAFDTRIRERFEATVQAALRGDLPASWDDGVWGQLAQIVVLDQFTRYIYRGTPQAFAGDERALALALQLCATGRDQELPAVARTFVLLPLEHAESLPIQQQCVDAFAQLLRDQSGAADLRPYLANTSDYAQRHLDVIAKFGRFPHRNAILGRTSTPQEREYLAQPGSGF